jgi:hypothetical protein
MPQDSATGKKACAVGSLQIPDAELSGESALAIAPVKGLGHEKVTLRLINRSPAALTKVGERWQPDDGAMGPVHAQCVSALPPRHVGL